MDTVFIEKLVLRGKHGVGEHERATEQEFLVDIAAEFDAGKAASSDRLEDAVDYGRFRAVAAAIVGGNSFFLIEQLAGRIAEEILTDNRITKVSVTVRKPAVYEDAVPGVTVVRTRGEPLAFVPTLHPRF